MKYIILLSLFLSGCASYFLKEKCEKTNWFNYSQEVAFSGRYLEEDGFVKDCKGVDRTNSQQLDLGFKLGRDKMCTYPEINKRGKEGEPVFFQFCDGLSQVQMRAYYTDGLKIFCTEPSGMNYGKSGSVYKKVCPMDWEIKFFKGYNPGRVQFLTLLVQTKTLEIAQLDRQYGDEVLQERNINRQYDLIPTSLSCSDRKVYDKATEKDVIKTICEENSSITSQRGDLISQLNRIRSAMSEITLKISNLREDIKKAQAELLVLQK